MRVPYVDDNPEGNSALEKESEIEGPADDEGIYDCGHRLKRLYDRRRQSEDERSP